MLPWKVLKRFRKQVDITITCFIYLYKINLNICLNRYLKGAKNRRSISTSDISGISHLLIVPASSCLACYEIHVIFPCRAIQTRYAKQDILSADTHESDLIKSFSQLFVSLQLLVFRSLVVTHWHTLLSTFYCRTLINVYLNASFWE